MRARTAKEISQKGRLDYLFLSDLLSKREPFTFIRFSDGEMEIVRNHRLFIGDGHIHGAKAKSSSGTQISIGKSLSRRETQSCGKIYWPRQDSKMNISLKVFPHHITRR